MINAYGIWLTGILLVANIWAVKRLKDQGISTNHIENMILIATPATLIGARAYHVLTDWNLYSDDVFSVFYIWHGGAGLWGALLFGFVSVLVYCKYAHISIDSLLSSITAPLFLVFSIGRWANVFNHELLPYAYYEAFVSTNILLLVLTLERTKSIKSSLFFVALIIYSLARIVLETVRLETRYGLFTFNQYVSLAMAILLSIGWKYLKVK